MLMIVSSQLFAQSLRISGSVKDESGQPVPGVNILEKGTTNGTVADAEGKYSINVSKPDATLVFSFIGYKTIEVSTNSRSEININMEADITALEEVVVTGYGSERKADLVSAVSQLSAANTIAIPVGNVEQALQGRVAGVLVQTSGQPGAPSQVRIRGFGSFQNNAPLLIVDGVPTFDASNINPYDIESTTVLKDAGAASIYGSRASGGVIVYTTKHGKYDGTTKVDFDMSTGLNFPGSGITMLTPQQQANKVYEALRNGQAANANNQPYGPDLNNPVIPDFINVGGVGNIFNGDPRIATALANYNINFDKGGIVQVVAANRAGTDWYKEMTRVAPLNRISLGISGGNDRAHYYLNLAHYDQQGLAINQFLRRTNMRFNSEFKPIKNLRIGQNLQLAFSENPRIGGAQDENELNQAYRMPTVIPVRDVNGGWAGTAAPGFNNPANPVASLTRRTSDYAQQANLNVFGNAFIEFDPIKNLTLRSSFGGEIGYRYGLFYAQRSYENAENPGNFQLNESAGYGLSWTFTNTARYERKFDAHSVKVMVGSEAVKNGIGRGLSASGLNPFSNSPNFISITNASPTGRIVNSSPLQQSTLASIFGRVDYNWNEKYYFSATFRRDGSSSFGPQSRYGTFSAFSGAWRISSESFMQDVKWIDDLKIRGGWGVMGNQQIDPANQFPLATSNPGVGYDITGSNSSVLPGFIPRQPGNLKGQWEENITTNIGLDGTFLNGTMEVILEFWQRNTDKLLYQPDLSATAGVFTNNPFVNIGGMVNKGIDLQIIKRFKIDNDWSLVLDGNISPLQNRITSVDGVNQFFDRGNFRNVQFIRNAVDQPLSSFFGYKTLGYFQNAADVTNSPTQDGAAPGRFKFQDVNGDGVISPADRVFMGSPVPNFTYGFNATVKYKNWSLDAFFYGKSGNQIVNFSKWYNGFYQSFSGAGLSAITLDSWTPEKGNNASTPIIETASNFSTNTQANSWYVEDGSYLRLRNLQVNYNVPSSFLAKHGLRTMKVFVQGTNIFTITKYTGKDPEVASQVDTILGVDVGNYPATQIWSLGFNLGF